MWWFFSVRKCSWVWLLSLTVFSSLVSFHCTLHCYIVECCDFLSEFIFALVFVDLEVDNPSLTAVPFLMAVLLVVHFYCKEIVKDLKVSELHICL